jgi:hypothetical protein
MDFEAAADGLKRLANKNARIAWALLAHASDFLIIVDLHFSASRPA